MLCVNCKSIEREKFKIDSNDYSAIVEIPAGTNKKFEYNHQNNSFECEIINGKKRFVNYLPYPGNYGYILNTYMDPDLGGDGDALDVLIIAESIEKGVKLNIKPIAILKLLDHGQEDHKIIAISKNSNLTLMKDSIPASVKLIISTWFCNYKGPNKIEYISWGDKNSALLEIEKWKL